MNAAAWPLVLVLLAQRSPAARERVERSQVADPEAAPADAGLERRGGREPAWVANEAPPAPVLAAPPARVDTDRLGDALRVLVVALALLAAFGVGRRLAAGVTRTRRAPSSFPAPRAVAWSAPPDTSAPPRPMLPDGARRTAEECARVYIEGKRASVLALLGADGATARCEHDAAAPAETAWRAWVATAEWQYANTRASGRTEAQAWTSLLRRHREQGAVWTALAVARHGGPSR